MSIHAVLDSFLYDVYRVAPGWVINTYVIFMAVIRVQVHMYQYHLLVCNIHTSITVMDATFNWLLVTAGHNVMYLNYTECVVYGVDGMCYLLIST